MCDSASCLLVVHVDTQELYYIYLFVCCLQVTRSALMNACGIAGIMLTTQAVMVEKKDPKSAGNAQAAMGGMGAGGMPAGMTM